MDSSEFLPSTEAIERLRRDLDTYEAERPALAKRTRLRLAAILGSFVVVVGGIFFAGMDIWFDSTYQFATIAFAACAFFAGKYAYQFARQPAADMQDAFRAQFFPAIFGFIDDMQHTRGVEPASFGSMPPGVVGIFNRKDFDDCVSGRFGDFTFDLFEAHLRNKSGKTTSSVFQGVVLAFELPHAFDGRLLATRRIGDFSKWFRDVFGTDGLVEITSGDAKLDEGFEFRTDNPDAAQALLGGGLAQALTAIGELWPYSQARLGLRGDRCFLLLPSDRNFFELPDIEVPLDYSNHIAPIIADMGRLLAIGRLIREATRVSSA